jgi:LEA14-like dessication related protein
MARVTKRRAFLAVALLGALAGGCIRVEAPQLQAQSMEFTGIDGNGLAFRVVFNAYNPNGYELNIRELSAQLTLDNNAAGSSVTALGVVLPPQRWVPVTASVVVPWNGAPAYLMAAAGSPTVSYTLQGTVVVEHYLSLRASFATRGTVAREFFLRGAAGSVNSMINSVLPGFGGVQVQ